MTDRWAGVLGDAERAEVCDVVDRWVARTSAEGTALVAAERVEAGDPATGAPRWVLRFRGEEKDVVTVWLTLHQRTLRHEVQLMPAPEEHVAETYEYLLRKGADLWGMGFAIGAEDALYLVGRVPVERVDDGELDRIAGASLAVVDECFPTAMSLGFASRFRRRPPAQRRR